MPNSPTCPRRAVPEPTNRTPGTPPAPGWPPRPSRAGTTDDTRSSTHTSAAAPTTTPDDGPSHRGTVVLVPRGGAWGDRVAAAARSRGLVPVVVPLITDEPPADPGPLDTAITRLTAAAAAVAAGAGEPWLVVTSATTVRVLSERVASLPSGVRVAAVGTATARAARAVGWPVDLVPDDASAAGLVTALPDGAPLVVHPRSDLAAPTLVDGLRARGTTVLDVVAYRTVGTGDGQIALDPAPDVVLVTSGSVAREVTRRLTPLDPRTRIACIGPGTATETRDAGLPVHVVAAERSAEALLDAVVESLTPHPEQEGHS
nr:uroporphyrinogen-III synthase [Curtobacterium sp. WW7]